MKQLVFNNLGGIQQMKIAGDEDLAQVQVLDPARWAATSAPAKDLQCDTGFLGFLDANKRGRVRVSDLIAAKEWLFKNLKGRANLGKKTETLTLADIDASHDDGKLLKTSAERVLERLNAPNKSEITLAQVRAFKAEYVKLLANGDGIVPAELCPDADTAAFIKDILTINGGANDLSGKPGAGEEHLAKFLEKAKAYQDWKAKGTTPAVRPLGDATDAAAALVQQMGAKIKQYFLQCDLVKQDPGIAAKFQVNADELKLVEVKDAALLIKQLADAPLSKPNPAGVLAADADVNPSYAGPWKALWETVIPKAAPDTRELTRDVWQKVEAHFAEFVKWSAEKPAEPFDKLGDERIAALLTGELPAKLREYIKIDNAAKPELDQLSNLEKLVLYHRWILEFANNFVSFSSLYHPKLNALFEMGSLVIDGRRLEFSVRVEARDAHKKIATDSKMFLVYAALTDQSDKTVICEIAAPVTSGERGNLKIGKRGIFIGVDGKEYDAQIVDLIENPISLWEAVKSPFVRASNFVTKKIEDMAGSKLAAAEKDAIESIDKGKIPVAPATPAAPPAKAEGGGMGPLLVGGGIALAAVGSTLAYAVQTIREIEPWHGLRGILGMVLVIASISAFLGWLRLRKRDMAPLMEANGWAINMQMKLTSRLGYTFTRRPALPKGSVKEKGDVLSVVSLDENDTSEGGRKSLFLFFVGIIAMIALVSWRIDVLDEQKAAEKATEERVRKANEEQAKALEAAKKAAQPATTPTAPVPAPATAPAATATPAAKP